MENEENNIEVVEEKFRFYLGMEYKPVGITLYPDLAPGPKPDREGSFCYFVRRAAVNGEEFLLSEDDISCLNAHLPLGLIQPRYVKIEQRIKEQITCVRVGPLQGCHIVLLVLSAEQIMTMSVLLSGIEAKFKGETAVCGETVAEVYNSGKPNVSFLCHGARSYGGFRPGELVLGLPVDIFMKLSEKMHRYSSLSKEAKAKAASLLAQRE